MDERKKSIAAVFILISFFIVLLVISKIFFARKVLSPVPDDSAIKIIFVTPTQSPTASPSAMPSLTPVPTNKST